MPSGPEFLHVFPSDLSPDLARIFCLEKEFDQTVRDEYDRVRHADTGYGNQVYHPIVTTSLSEQGALPISWPNGADWCLMLSHDVDHLNLSRPRLKQHLRKAFQNRSVTDAFHSIQKFLDERKNSPHYIEEIMELEKKYAATSTFFFMATHDPDQRYDVSKYTELIQTVAMRGWEVGLHAGMYSYQDPEIIKTEKARLEKILGQSVIGVRQHYLRFDPKKTLQAQQDAGFLYDSTFGYPDHVGFKNGCAHPHYPIDPGTGQPYRILEIPLALMDGSINHYMGIPFETQLEEAWSVCQRILDAVRDARGCISVLWHNDQFDSLLHPNSAALYERILAYGQNQNAWMTSGSSVYQHLTKKEQTM